MRLQAHGPDLHSDRTPSTFDARRKPDHHHDALEAGALTETLSAVTRFQKHEGLDRDEVVGAMLREHLKHPTGSPRATAALRTHHWDQNWLFPQIPVGTQIVIYGGDTTAPTNAGSGY